MHYVLLDGASRDFQIQVKIRASACTEYRVRMLAGLTLMLLLLYIYILYITLGNRVDMAVGCLTEQI